MSKLINLIKDKGWKFGINFIITVFGILIALYLGNSYQQKLKDRDTNTKLNLMLLEMDENIGYIEIFREQHSDTSEVYIKHTELDNSAAISSLQAENIFRILPSEHIMLIRGYIKMIDVLNEYHQSYRDLSFKIEPKTLFWFNKLRSIVLGICIEILATCTLIKQELIDYVKEGSFKKEKMENYNKRKKELEKMIEQGKVKFQ